MRRSRRSWFAVVAALAGSGVRAAGQGALSTKVSRFEDLAVNPGGKNRFRPIVEGLLHDGHPIEAHATELAPGNMPHGSHRHKHEEMFLIREGAVEVTVNGKSTRLGPGGVAFIASGEDHGVRNLGDTPAHYFVIALGRD